MRTCRVHIETELIVGEELTLDKSRSHYLKQVLRLKSGAAFLLFNGREAIDYHATLILEGKQAKASIDAATPLSTESKLGCEVLQGLGGTGHMDWMIQKTTELGVKKISLFNAERTQSPLKSSQFEKKLTHWRGVATSACEQCGRAIVPEISLHQHLQQALAASTIDFGILLNFEGDALTSSLLSSPGAVSILLGPEGGLNPSEIKLAKDAGFKPIRLGPRVLRAETAAATALAIVQTTLGDLN